MAGIDWEKGQITPPKQTAAQEGATDWEKGDIQKPAGFARKAGDLGLSLLKGAIAIPEAAVGLADIPTGGRVGKFLENEGGAIGFRPKQAKEVISGWQSDDLRGKTQAFQSADGVIDKAGVALSNPSLIANAVAESVPLMGAGGVIGRGVMAAAPRLGAVGAGALGEGVVGAGSAAEQIRQESSDGLLTPTQAGLAGLSGAATAGFGALGGKVAQKLGIGDVDTMVVNGTLNAGGAASKGFLRRGAEGALSEGLLEELPQSLSEQAIQNVAQDKPITEGLADAAVMGTLAGAAMGGGAGVLSGFGAQPGQQTQPPAPPPATDPTQPPLALGFNPKAGTHTVFPDGSVILNSETPAGEQAVFDKRYAPQVGTFGSLMDTDGIYQGWSNVRDGSDRQAMRDQIDFVAKNYAGKVSAENADTVAKDLAQQFKWFRAADPTRQKMALQALSRPAQPATPSQAMGLDPAAGPMSAAAATAVDGGASAQVQQAQALAAAAEAGPKTKTLDEATPEERAAYDAATFDPTKTKQGVADRRKVAIEGMLERAAIQGENQAGQQPTEDFDVPFGDERGQPDAARGATPDEGATAGVAQAGAAPADAEGVSGPGAAADAGKPQRFAALNGQQPQAQATTGQKVKSLKEFMAKKRAEREAQNVQDPTPGTAGAQTQTTAGQAPQAVGGQPAGAAAGVPAAGDAGVEADGVGQAGRDGYDTPVELDAASLKAIVEKARGESLVNKPEKLEAWRNGTAKTDTKKFPIELALKPDGTLDVNDGRHRIALAAERGEKVTAFVAGKDAVRVQEQVESMRAPAAQPAPAAIKADLDKLTIPEMTDAQLQATAQIYPDGSKRAAKARQEIERRTGAKQQPTTEPINATRSPEAAQAVETTQKGPQAPAAPAAVVGDDEQGAQWNRMTTTEREAVATRAGLNKVAVKNLARRGWQGLDKTQQQNLRKGFEPVRAAKYELPKEGVSASWFDGKKRSNEHPDFEPTPRQQELMDAVAKALDEGVFYNRDLDERVASMLGVTQEQRASNSQGVDGGDFGYDVYHARKAVEAKRRNASQKEIARELNLKPGDVLGTLMFNDGKVTNSVEVVSLSENGISASFKGKRGPVGVTFDTELSNVKYAVERAHERRKRKDSYEQFIAARKAAPEAGPKEPNEVVHNDARIYRTRTKVGDEVKDMWAVESPENKARRAAGERTLGGDTLHDTIEQAKAAADREAKQFADRKAFAEQQDAEERARKEAEEARKASNRGKSILERRKDAVLDGPTKLPASAGLGNTTRRNAMQMAVEQGRAVVERQVDDSAAKKRDQEAVDRVRRAGYMLGLSNENIPVVKAGLEAQARLKANDYKKPEYRVYGGSEPTGSFHEITKTEYEYAQELMAKKAQEPVAARDSFNAQDKADAFIKTLTAQEVGPFGPILTQYRGDAQGAIKALTALKDGEAVAALSHPEIGYIDLVWGKEGTRESNGFGLSKLVKWHPEVLDDLQGVVSSLTVVERTENRIQLESDKHKAAVRLEWDKQAKHWLLTAFEKKEAGGGTRTDTAANVAEGDTARLDAGTESLPQPTPPAQGFPKLTQAEARELMEWQDLGQKDGIKTHILAFYASKADKDANRGRMTVATVTKEADSKNWVVDGTDERLAMLGMAKKKAETAGMAKAVADGFVEPAQPTEAPAQPKTVKQGITNARAKKAAEAEAQRAEYFAPGNILKGYGGHDRVLEYTPPDENGRWSVRVQRVVKQGEQWVDAPNERPRWHSTPPEAKELASGPVDTVPVITREQEKALYGYLREKTEGDAGRFELLAAKFRRSADGTANAGDRKITLEWLQGMADDGDARQQAAAEGEKQAAERAEQAQRASDDKAAKQLAELKAGRSQNPNYQAFLDTLEQDDLDAVTKSAQLNVRFMAFVSQRQAEFEKAGGGSSPEAFAQFVRDYADKNLASRLRKGVPPAGAKAGDPARIADFGEKIGGARKDVWTGFKDDLTAVSDDDIAGQPLTKVWPAPDYQKLIDSGMDPEVVAFVRAARDEVPAKPRSSWKVKRWAEQVKALRGFALSMMDGSITISEARRSMGHAKALSRGMDGFLGRIDLYKEVGHGKSLEGVRFSLHNYTLYRGEENVSLWVVEKDAASSVFGNFPREIATGKTKEEALQDFKAKYATLDLDKAVRQASFDIVSKPGIGGYFIAKKVGRNYATMEGPFATLKEAREYRQNNLTALQDKLEKFKEIPRERADVNQPRVGVDMRNGQDVTPEMFGEVFGFRGVEFGNWVEQKRRQKDLNDAFDALMDMAAVLNIPAKAISLNGRLGLAFGARGSGGVNPAAAHYEPDNVVINLTKKEGAGSLGHEWWHALDNYFSKQRKQGADFMTEALDVKLAARSAKYQSYDGVRKEMIEAFGAVVRSINQTAMKARSDKLDGKRSKEYWTTGAEMSARAFESYLISKLQDQNASNDYLANVVSQETWDAMGALGIEMDDSYPYPTAGEIPVIRAGFDLFFQTVQARETDAGTIELYRTTRAPGLTANTQLSQDAVKQSVASALKRVVGAPPVQVARRPEDLGIPNPFAPAVPKGVTLEDGSIVVFSDGAESVVDVFRTVFHELFHRGTKVRFTRNPDYITKMLEIAAADPMVQAEVEAWKKSDDAKDKWAEFKERGPMTGERLANFEALAVEEALATMAERIGMGELSQPQSLVQKLARFLAKVAESWGMGPLALWLRNQSATSTERFVMDTLAMSGGTPGRATTARMFNARQQAELASLFDALQAPRGVKLAQAQRQVGAHPMAQAIREVEATFLDTLAGLDDAKLIQINC